MLSGKGPVTDPWFQDFLHTTQPFGAMLQPLNTGQVQVIYTRVDRDARNVPYFHDFYYQVDTDRYFYPASTVKLPMAAAALEKLNAGNHRGVVAGTPYITVTPPLYDFGYASGTASSVARDIELMLTVSSNTAFNRLYQFVGPCDLRRSLFEKGYPHAEIRHLLGLAHTGAGHPYTAACDFTTENGGVYREPAKLCSGWRPAGPPRHDFANARHYDLDGRLVPGPMDFSARNRMNLPDLHQLLRSIIFPDTVTFEQRFRLTDADNALLLRCLGQWPGQMQTKLPGNAHFTDTYAKFLLPDGDTVRSFNKAGWAFGFLTDTAYIADPENGIEFCLTATIAVHDDATTSDSPAHDSIGRPFLKALGNALYAHERQRPKKYYPDLQRYANSVM